MSLRPGASEVFRVIVPCELVDGKRHEVRLRLKVNNNRVTFEGMCDWRTAQAVEKLSDALTCRQMIEGLKFGIRAGHGDVNVNACDSCAALVVSIDRRWCPNCGDHRLREVPVWQRIRRDGRVS